MRVRFFAYIRNFTGCAEAEFPYETLTAAAADRDNPDGCTVGDLARYLCNLYGEKFKEKIFPPGNASSNNKEEKFGPEIIILINGRHVNHLGGSSAPLKPDDRVDLFPVVAGG